MDNAKTNCRPGTRKLIQLYSALLYNAHLRGFAEGDIYQGGAKYACVPGLNCYSCPGAVGACPLGALQNALASSGHRAGWYAAGILLLFGTVLGRTVCGWLCPFGLFQELLHKIPTYKLGKSRATRLLTNLKYVFLAVPVVAVPLWYGLRHDLPVPGFCKVVCPAGTLEGAAALLAHPENEDLFGMLGAFFTWKLVVLIAVCLVCIFCWRGFCRFVCPLGAIYGLFNRFCMVGVKVDTDRCTGCGRCVSRCGMDVKAVGDRECIQCAGCADVCPENAISFRAGPVTLLAPEGVLGREEREKRTRAGRAARAAALAVLGFALVWFNFLDPSVRTEGRPDAGAPAEQSEPAVPTGSQIGMRPEDFTVTCLDGTEFRLSETRGKVTFINLWATYCAPCVKELPYFDDLCREHEDVAVLAVHSSVVTDDPVGFLAGRGYVISFAVDTDDTVWRAVGGSSTIPQTIVLDRDGVVIFNQKGSVTPEMLSELYARASAGAETAVVNTK